MVNLWQKYEHGHWPWLKLSKKIDWAIFGSLCRFWSLQKSWWRIQDPRRSWKHTQCAFSDYCLDSSTWSLKKTVVNPVFSSPLLQEAYAVDTKGRGFTIPVRVSQESWLFRDFMGKQKCVPLCVITVTWYIYVCPSSYKYIIYGSILFFMFLFVDANWKDLKSRWCQNLKWMQGSLTSKDFMEILGGNLHSHSFLRLEPGMWWWFSKGISFSMVSFSDSTSNFRRVGVFQHGLTTHR